MFRSNFDHSQRDIFFFTSVTKGKIIWFVVACLKKYLPEDGQSLTETSRRILRILKQYDHCNVLF
jgi:hypothetical protein